MSEPQREMSLEEWCGKLPSCHRVNKELVELQQRATPQEPKNAMQILTGEDGVPLWAPGRTTSTQPTESREPDYELEYVLRDYEAMERLREEGFMLTKQKGKWIYQATHHMPEMCYEAKDPADAVLGADDE